MVRLVSLKGAWLLALIVVLVCFSTSVSGQGWYEEIDSDGNDDVDDIEDDDLDEIET